MRRQEVSAECLAFVAACARVEEEVRQLRTELVRLVDAADRVADASEVGVERMNTRFELIVRCLGALGRE